MPELTSSKKYDKNVIIAYASSPLARPGYYYRDKKIACKYGADNLILLTLDANNQPIEPDEWQRTFSQLTYKSRIYISAHAAKHSIQDGTYFYDNSVPSTRFQVSDLAELLAQYMVYSQQLSDPRVDAGRDVQRLTIALWACYAGFSSRTADSYMRFINCSHAALLAYFLNVRYDYAVDVSGRTNLMFATSDQPIRVPYSDKESLFWEELRRDDELLKESRALRQDMQSDGTQADPQIIRRIGEIQSERNEIIGNLNQNIFFGYHDLRSKVIYSYRDGYQIVLPGYTPKNSHDRWRWDAFETVIDCMVHTRVQVKQNGLSQLLNKMICASIKDIFYLIQTDLVRGERFPCFSDYGLYDNSSIFGKYSPFPTRTVSQLRGLLSRFPSDIDV